MSKAKLFLFVFTVFFHSTTCRNNTGTNATESTGIDWYVSVKMASYCILTVVEFPCSGDTLMH